ncbi:hypothetical protein QWY15_16835 [Planococcus sp. N064]|uniref:YxiS n=1 Tax=Planococcus liqunii TaxID=3058394 RepID=A0ABT8MW57_9BACL|nr:hypothetical protein [Planococcus sp. N064]MDN7228940.1 hypothetical protein [Planococcus sp. N064]
MEFENRDEYIIKKYQQDEDTMIRLFVHWCLNHDLDPVALYTRAYPHQPTNEALLNVVKETKTDPAEIEVGTATMLEVLQIFGNDDLAFVVAEEAEKSKD